MVEEKVQGDRVGQTCLHSAPLSLRVQISKMRVLIPFTSWNGREDYPSRCRAVQ